MLPGSRPGREISVFLAITLALSSPFYVLISSAGGLRSLQGQLWLIGLMWCPGISALAVNFLFHRTVAGLGWGWGRTRLQVLAFLLPFTYVSVVYLLIWALGFGTFNQEVWSRVAQVLGLASLPTPLGFVGVLVIEVAFNTLPYAIVALGEELGWRGFLVPRLVERSGFTRASLISGFVWAVWHYPIILYGGYHGRAPVAFEMVSFTVMVVGLSFLLTWLRLRSGSVWSPVLLHASHNILIQRVFEPFTADARLTPWLTGEFGAGLALAVVVLGYLFWRRRAAVAPSPSDHRTEAGKQNE